MEHQTVYLIDTNHEGESHGTGCWLLDGAGPALVDPGPEPCIETVLSGINRHGVGVEDIRAVLISHIHLDHSGACGRLAEMSPDLKFYVHERGAPHLVNPDRLLRSAERLYGDQMEKLWGEILPVPVEQVVDLSGGETLEIGDRSIDVLYTPGHASHHVTYFDHSDRAAYTGDVGGMKLMHGFVIPPTPPPDIDLDLWFASIDKLAALKPAALRLAHYGEVIEVDGHLTKLRRRLETWSAAVEKIVHERLRTPVGSDPTGVLDPLPLFIDAIKADLAQDGSPQQVDEYVDKTHFSSEQQYLGLERYWNKKLK